MSVTKKAFLLAPLLLAAAVLLYWYAALRPTGVTPAPALRPTLVGDDFTGTLYAPDGRLDKFLRADRVQFYEKQHLLDLKRPRLVHFDHDADRPGGERWQLDCDFARVRLGETAYLRGAIALYPLFVHPSLRRITAVNADYDLRQRTVTSAGPVTVYGHDFIDVGTRFTARIPERQFTYLGHPHATYYPPTAD